MSARKFLKEWELWDEPITREQILTTLRDLLVAGDGDAPDVDPVHEKDREQCARELAVNAVVAVALGLKLERARLRTVVEVASRLVRPLRSGAEYEFRAAGRRGMSERGVEWRLALAFRAPAYALYLAIGRRLSRAPDFDSRFGFGCKREALVGMWDEHEYLRSGAESDLWWLLRMLKPAIVTLMERLLEGRTATGRSVEALVRRTLGPIGLRAIEERTWRSRVAFGLPLAAVNQTLKELGLEQPPRPVATGTSGSPLASWPMASNRLVN